MRLRILWCITAVTQRLKSSSQLNSCHPALSPPPRTFTSVVRQSGLQLVWPLRGAPQVPPGPALLHPPPRLHVAPVGPDSKQHSGEHPAQSPLIRLHRWVRTLCTHIQVGAGNRSPPSRCLCTLISQFPFADNGRQGGCTKTRGGACAFPQAVARWWIFYLCRAQWRYQHAAQLRIDDCRRRLVACGVQTSARPTDPPSCQSRLHVAASHQFPSVFFPLHSTRTKQPAMAGTIAHRGPGSLFFSLSSSSFSYLMCAAGIFTAVTGCANISSPPRRLWASSGCDISFRPKPKAPFESDICALSVNLPGNQSADFTFPIINPTWRAP